MGLSSCSTGAQIGQDEREAEPQDLHEKIGQLVVERDFLCGTWERCARLAQSSTPLDLSVAKASGIDVQPLSLVAQAGQDARTPISKAMFVSRAVIDVGSID